jgi:hypothetical protein
MNAVTRVVVLVFMAAKNTQPQKPAPASLQEFANSVGHALFSGSIPLISPTRCDIL